MSAGTPRAGHVHVVRPVHHLLDRQGALVQLLRPRRVAQAAVRVAEVAQQQPPLEEQLIAQAHLIAEQTAQLEQNEAQLAEQDEQLVL